MAEEYSDTVAEHRSDIDWQAVERSPEFRELVRKKKAFVIPATVFFLVWYFGFIFLAGYAEDFMGREFITDGLTVGYALALSQFIMVWVLGSLYLRRADKVFDPLAARARDAVLDTGARDGRFERRETVEPTGTGTDVTGEAPPR